MNTYERANVITKITNIWGKKAYQLKILIINIFNFHDRIMDIYERADVITKITNIRLK